MQAKIADLKKVYLVQLETWRLKATKLFSFDSKDENNSMLVFLRNGETTIFLQKTWPSTNNFKLFTA